MPEEMPSLWALGYFAVLLVLGVLSQSRLVKQYLVGGLRPRLPRWEIPAPDATLLIMCLVAWYILGGSLAFSLIESLAGENMATSPAAVLAGSLLVLGGLAAIFLLFWVRHRGDEGRLSPLALSWVAAFAAAVRHLLAILPLFVGGLLLWYFFLTLLRAMGLPIDLETPQQPVEMFQEASSLAERLAIAGLAVLVAPLAEELVFRAGIYRILRGKLGVFGAAALTGLVFGVAHFHFIGLVGLGILGAGFCLAYEWTGSLRVPILMHALFNAHQMAILWFTGGN